MVQTPVDSDADGELDRVGVDIIRPRPTESGLRVPVIINASPYYDNLGRGNESERKKYDEHGKPVKFPLFYDNYFVPRGYAVAEVDMLGTNNSQGCPVTGGPAEVRGVEAVIDWLNGRAAGYDADGDAAMAYWTTGKAGMVGKSYDGTLANAVAATGVEGLETIVPIAAISSWYDYYRYGGAIYYRHGPPGLAGIVDTDPDAKCADVRQRLDEGADDASGDYNSFWKKRDYVDGVRTNTENVHASVFAVHGRNDPNVKPNHLAQWWKGLSANHVPRKLWLSLRGHVAPFDFRRDVWIDTLHRWFDRWLCGIHNGIMQQPRVDIEVGPDEWKTYGQWPARGTRQVRLSFGPAKGKRPGTLTHHPVQGPRTQSFTGDPKQTEPDMVAGQFSADPNRLVYLSPPLKHSVRLSGTPQVRLRASADRTDTNLTALVVDYGTALRVSDDDPGHTGVKTLDKQGCYGKSTKADDACYHLTKVVTSKEPQRIVSRGWLDSSNRDSLTHEKPLEPGKTYTFRWKTLPHDYVFEAGHRIAVVVAAGDYGHIVSDEQARGATVTVSLRRSSVSLPIVGGRRAIDW